MRIAAMLLAATVLAGPAHAAGPQVIFKGTLSGAAVVPTRYSAVTGQVALGVSGDAIGYTVRYGRGLEGQVEAVDLVLGRQGVDGGDRFLALLCGGAQVRVSGQEDRTIVSPVQCPSRSGGSVGGTLRAADIVAVGDDGIGPGEIGKLVEALRAGLVYAEVRTYGRTSPAAPSELRADLR